MDTSGTVEFTFTIPGPASRPVNITVDETGDLWFTLLATSKIGRYSPTATEPYREYSHPDIRQPVGITLGPDRNIWFTSLNSWEIGKIDRVSGQITMYNPQASADPPGTRKEPFVIVQGPDGHVWYTLREGNRIGRINPATGTVTTFAVPTVVPCTHAPGSCSSKPSGITVGPDGNLWFTELHGNKIGRITPSGTITEYPLPTPGRHPSNIVAGPDGYLWFTEAGGSKIGRIDRGGTIVEFDLSASSHGITVGPDLAIWFTEQEANRLGRIVVDQRNTVQPAAASSLAITGLPSSLTAGTQATITVTARDPFMNVATGYRGTVRFTSNDPMASLPGDYAFTAADNGTKTFQVTLRTAGSRSITATDIATGTIAGSATAMVQPAGRGAQGITGPSSFPKSPVDLVRGRQAASALGITGLSSSLTAGVPGTLTVTAGDAFGNIATGYCGTVRLTSTDPTATLPMEYTFTAADNGVRSFNVVLRTPGTHGITVTDTQIAAVTASQTGIIVNSPRIVVLGMDASAEPRVIVFDAVTLAMRYNFLAFVSTFRGGVRTAVADVTGDGAADILVASGPGMAAQVRMFDGASPGPVPTQLAGPLGSFAPYGTFSGGVFIAAGDIVAPDGRADVFVAPDAGLAVGSSLSPPIVMYNGATGSVLDSGHVYEPTFTGGVRIAVADVNADGNSDLITIPGPGRAPTVVVISGADASLLRAYGE